MLPAPRSQLTLEQSENVQGHPPIEIPGLRLVADVIDSAFVHQWG